MGQRILLLQLQTGGGHIGTARAIAREIDSRGRGAETHILNGLGENPSRMKKLVENGYTSVSVEHGWIWPLIYLFSVWRLPMNIQTWIMSKFAAPVIRRAILEHNIDTVVVLHFLLVRASQAAISSLPDKEVRTFTIVTDPFTVHPLWGYRQNSEVLVFSERAARSIRKLVALYGQGAARRTGVPVTVVPPIIDARYTSRIDDASIERFKEFEGLRKKAPMLLLAGGGDGLPGAEALLQKLLPIVGGDVDIVLVCGKNQRQYKKAVAIAAEYPRVHIKVCGFVRTMYEFMNAATLVVAKAGPATVFEVLSLAKPLIVSSYFFGQEKGNVDFLRNKGLGLYESDPAKLAKLIVETLARPDELARLEAAMKKAPPGIGTALIADKILG